jgi:hypothetical protein
MADQCELLSACDFFAKYQATKSLVCQGFILKYCKGTEMNNCERKRYRQEHGTPPSDDMMPSGRMVIE